MSQHTRVTRNKLSEPNRMSNPGEVSEPRRPRNPYHISEPIPASNPEGLSEQGTKTMTTEQRIEQLQRELDALKTELQTKESEPKPEWPKKSDYYYFIDSDGSVICTSWCGSNYDKARLAMGNRFRTEAEARRRKAIWMSAQPCGPEPKVGETVWVIGGGWDFMAHRAYAQSPWFVCAYNEGWLSTSRDELEKRIKRFGWAFRGEPEPEGWDTE